MFYTEIFAGDSFVYSANISLANTMTWQANGLLTTLDLTDVFDPSNNEIGVLTANLQPIISNLPNNINYTLTLTASPNVTTNWISNSVNINERRLYLFTKFTSNTGTITHGNSTMIIVKAAPNT